jgi:N12 class adenine-specific DNA methylase
MLTEGCMLVLHGGLGRIISEFRGTLAKAAMHDGAAGSLFGDEPSEAAVVPATYALKHPHEMTQAEHREHVKANDGAYQGTLLMDDPKKLAVATAHIEKRADDRHYAAVLKQVAAGHPIHAHVLADYPQLKHLPVIAAPQAPHVPETRAGKRAVRRAEEAALSLFDEEAHPRAEIGMVRYNPETGKKINPGQFAPKEGTNGNEKPIRQDVSGEHAGEPTADVRGGRAGRQAGRADRERARSGDGESGELDFGGMGSGDGPATGDRGTDAAGHGAGAGSEPEPVHAPVAEVHTEQHSSAELTPDERETLASFQSPYKSGLNYRISEADHVGKGGESQKYADNIAALKTLLAIEHDGRDATPEEQAILVKYTGWGWAGQLFHYANSLPQAHYWNRWKKQHDELKALLTDEEWKAAAGSTVNAHYTAPGVITAMWDAVKHLGFQSGRIIEPAAGIGHFLGLMPPEIWAQSPCTAVELDAISARITQHLYQGADVHLSGFENSNTPEHFYDLAISNVPFGNYGVTDKLFDKPGLRFLRTSIHNYFFARSLAKLRAGGIVAFVTSSFTMDAPTSKRVREYLNRNAELLGAIRLPNDAFKENAGTEVTTDIIFLRKRGPKETATGEDWAGVTEIDTPDGKVAVNDYFARHPEMMLGQMGLQGSQYHENQAALKSDGRDITQALAEAIQHLPQNIYERASADARSLSANFAQADAGQRIGNYVEQDGKLFQVDPGERIDVGTDENGNAVFAAGPNVLTPVELNATTAARVRAMILARDAANDLVRIQADPHTTELAYMAARTRANWAYDSFVSKHGHIHDTANLRAFASDPDLAMLCAIENYDPKTKECTKADILSQRTVNPHRIVTSAENGQQAMLYALNETNRLDWDRMSQLTGKPPEALQAELATAGMVFHNPQGDWETSDSYLSGDVREKLKAAEASARLEPRYQPNVLALQAVQPPDLTPADIEARMGASWIPPTDIRDFIHHLVDMPAWERDSKRAVVRYIPQSAQWVVSPPGSEYASSARATNTWGTKEKNAVDLVIDTLNMKQPVVGHYDEDKKFIVDTQATASAQMKQQEVKAEFSRWLWADTPRANRLSAVYNEAFNNTVPRQFDGQHLELPGMSAAAKSRLMPHIKDAIWRIVQSKNTLLDHAVGAGKTWEVVGAAMELRRQGIARKPMIAVPNHLVGQWANEFKLLYPGAKVLMATKKDFEKKNRKKFMARIATGDWDAVVIAHSSFGRIPVSPETERSFYQEQINDLSHCMEEVAIEDGKKGPTHKELEKQRKRLQSKLEQRMERQSTGTDDFIPFEQLGIDHLFVDEAHCFKNLWFPTKMQRVKGLPNSESQRAFDMYMKTQAIQKMNNGGGVTFATGTPITNTIAEMYTQQRYLDGDWLKKNGLAHFDAWANNFGEHHTTVEYTVAGGLKPTTRFNRFFNVPELATAFRRFADVKTREDLHLPVPEVERVNVAAQPSAWQTVYVKSLAERAEQLRNVDPRVDNMLKITSDGRKNSLDPRLISPRTPDYAGSKVNLCINNVAQTYHDTAADKLTQTIFLDMSTPKAHDAAKEKIDAEESGTNDEADDTDSEEEHRLRGSVYADIRAKLHAKGVKPEEIAFIHDAKTDLQKAELFTAMNDGRIRVLLGSTEKMGTGMNAQRKMIALHHLDCPWRPDMLEQREGRIIRQGNQNKHVKVYTYATAGENNALSMDAFMWQTVEGKAKAINSVKGGNSARTVDDVDDMVLTSGQMKALASGNPLLQKLVEVEGQVRHLAQQEAAHNRNQWQTRRDMESLPGRMQSAQEKITRLQAVVTHREANKPEKFAATIGGQHYDSAGKAGAEILRLAKNIGSDTRKDPLPIGHYGGFDLSLAPDPIYGSAVFYMAIPGKPGYVASDSIADIDEGGHVITRMQSCLNRIGKELTEHKDKLARYHSDSESLQGALRPFPKAEELRTLQSEYVRIETELGSKKDESAAVVQEEPVEKAIALGKVQEDGSRAVRGSASASPQFGPSSAGAGLHADRLAPIARAAGGVRGLSLGTSRYKAKQVLGSSGKVGIAHAYTHQFHASNAGAAVVNMAQRLSGTHHIDPASHKVSRSVNAQGLPMEHHSFSAVGKHWDGTHHITVSSQPGVGDKAFQVVLHAAQPLQNPRKLAQSFRQGVANAGQSAGQVAGAARRLLTQPLRLRRSDPAPVEDKAHTDPIHAVAQQIGAAHYTSDVAPAKRNVLGGKTDRSYNHWYTHQNPHVKARQMQAAYMQAGHHVGDMQQKRVYLGNGDIRHQYSFHVTDPHAGVTHAVNLFRG